MFALSSHSSLCVFAMNLVLCQVRETDTDGGQGLCVIRLHDVTQQSHPELLGQGCEEEARIRDSLWLLGIDKAPPRLKPCRLPPGVCGRFRPYLASIPNTHKLGPQLTFLPKPGLSQRHPDGTCQVLVASYPSYMQYILWPGPFSRTQML